MGNNNFCPQLLPLCRNWLKSYLLHVESFFSPRNCKLKKKNASLGGLVRQWFLVSVSQASSLVVLNLRIRDRCVVCLVSCLITYFNFFLFFWGKILLDSYWGDENNGLFISDGIKDWPKQGFYPNKLNKMSLLSYLKEYEWVMGSWIPEKLYPTVEDDS